MKLVTSEPWLSARDVLSSKKPCFDCFRNLSTCIQSDVDVEATREPYARIEPHPEFDNDGFNWIGSDTYALERRLSKIQIVNVGVVIHDLTYLGRTMLMTVWMPVQQMLIKLKQVHWSHGPMNGAVILEAGRLQAAGPSSGRPGLEVGESRPSHHASPSAEQPAA